MKGTVVKSTGSWYEVIGEDGKEYGCRIRGKLRLEGIKETNPVAVGDYVDFHVEEGSHAITEILPRKNHLLRKSVKKTGHSNVLAANIDLAILIATIDSPRTSLGFIDRFLVSAEAYRVPQCLVFNKTDLLSEEQQATLEKLKSVYTAIGVTVLSISALQNQGVKELEKIVEGKTCLIAGHSGVGKSTILNMLLPEAKQAVSEISSFSNKGTHTTTFAEMFQRNEKTFLIDTPGVKEWGLVDMNPQEISDYFPEMRDRRLDCKFGARCLHLQEPKCAIVEAVEKGEIELSRYQSYLSMVNDDDNRK
jgi:ribosome biogenesis GTPase